MRGTRGGLVALVVGLAALALLVGSGGATTAPNQLVLDPVGSFSNPTFLTSPPGDTHRLFIVEQGGTIKLEVDRGSPTTFMTVPNVSSGGERGLLSMSFRPDYATSGIFYVYYTRASDGAIQVDEFQRSADPSVGDPNTRRPVITVLHPGESNHNGGQLEFGPDGMLYMGTGDGGGGGDPFRTGQNLQDLRGKILRIDPRQSGADPYTVPSNNPFVGQAPWKPEIWAYGVRNPWRFSFDRGDPTQPSPRPGSGDFTLGDVGQNVWEEIDYRPIGVGWGRGVNFGWSCMEGNDPYNGGSNCPVP